MSSAEPPVSSAHTPTPASFPAGAGGGEDTLVQDEVRRKQAAELSLIREKPPGEVPGYEFLRKLGEGSYGSVWLARERNTGKHVAVKFYTHQRGLDWSLLSREVEKLAVLYTSRNIVRLQDVGWDADPPYYVMEFLENGSLASLLSDGPIPVHEAVRISQSVARALVHAHGSGILHCDLKPANVLLDAEFEPRICDFGQSRLTNEQNPALGTLFYMAPEQADLEAVPDARWDVYALGALMYQMLTGHAPHRSPDNENRIKSAGSLEERLAEYRRILRESPRPTQHRRRGVDKALAEIIDRCLRTDPSRRYPNVQAVLDRLQARERQRARRPLLMLGLLGPALLLGTLIILAVNASQTALEKARDNQVRRALESDRLSADILAQTVLRDLDERKNGLMDIARDSKFQQAVKLARGQPWERRQEIFAPWAKRKQQDDETRDDLGRPKDTSWFLTDADGVQSWRTPVGDSIGKSYWWREYFNGVQQFDPDNDERPPTLKPISEPHISLPFISTVTGQYMVAVSVAVRDPETGEVIAVLARSVGLGELLEEYAKLIRKSGHVNPTGKSQVDRIFALIAPAARNEPDGRWILLDHPWLREDATQARLKDMGRKALHDRLTFDPPQAVTAANGSEPAGRVDAFFRDPVQRIAPQHFERAYPDYGEYSLAAFSPVRRTGWTVVVQESREHALQPVEEMQAKLLRYGIWGLMGFVLIVGLLWTYVGRAIKGRGLQVRPFRLSGTGTLTSGTATSTSTGR